MGPSVCSVPTPPHVQDGPKNITRSYTHSRAGHPLAMERREQNVFVVQVTSCDLRVQEGALGPQTHLSVAVSGGHENTSRKCT